MRVGIVGDLHAPFDHPMYLRFCVDTFTAWKVNHTHLIGDLFDNHALSFHEHDPNGMSAGDESDKAGKRIAAWQRTFNDTTASIGNHDERPFRLARKNGLPDRFLKSYADVWNTPGWDWQFEHILDGVLYIHGTGHSGKNAALNAAIEYRMPVVMGHIHANAGANYQANPRSRIFGLSVGCGLDVQSYAMAYGRAFTKRPVLGCGIVADGEFAFFIPMPCGKGEKYHRSRAGKRKRKRAA